MAPRVLRARKTTMSGAVMHMFSDSSLRHDHHTSESHLAGACYYCVRMCLKWLPASLPLTVYSYGMKRSRYDNSGIHGRAESSCCASRMSPVCRIRDPRSRPRTRYTGYSPSRRRNIRPQRCGTLLPCHRLLRPPAQALSCSPTLEPQERLRDTLRLPQEQGPSNFQLLSSSLHSPSVSVSTYYFFALNMLFIPCHVLYRSRSSAGRFRGPYPLRNRGWRIRNDGEASGKTSPAAPH